VSKRTALVRRAGAGSAEALGQSSEARPVASEAADLESVAEIALPREHPKWAKDRFTVSAATKRWLDRAAPFAIRVFGFWDHRAHRLALEGATVEVDVSGSYRSDSLPRSLENRTR
jgi:hypothetical protein